MSKTKKPLTGLFCLVIVKEYFFNLPIREIERTEPKAHFAIVSIVFFGQSVAFPHTHPTRKNKEEDGKDSK